MAPAASRKIAVAYDDRPLASIKQQEENGAASTSPAADAVAVHLREVAVLPSSTDNCAIASRTLHPGLRIILADGCEVALKHTVLEGHRFAVRRIAVGEHLTSWGLGFGSATRQIEAGDYCCNDSILAALQERSVQASLPAEGCFENYFDPLPDPQRSRDFSSPGVLDLAAWREAGNYGFQGFARPGGRGVGTRNFLLLLGTTIHAAPFVRRLERKFRGLRGDCFDGVVAVAHTEGDTAEETQNWWQLVRCMAGFLIHPNVAACVAVDHPSNPLRESIEALMCEDPVRYRGLEALPLRWFTVDASDIDASLHEAEALVQELLPLAKDAARSWQPASQLIVAQQCGGSDAFSGVNGNPASGGAVRHLIAAGGKAVLAETDELIGAESYILSRIRDEDTEKKYLELRQRYQEYARRHGHSAEGNPSGGNKFRGLYNIALKSLGAAMKKPPDIRLEGCLEYGERLVEDSPGYFFMDSPGNDPESIAGQVASGCNVIHFITGNGSITNFPFVPTVKIITTQSRWQLLSSDMDFNAGRLQLGETLEGLGEELFKETLEVAGGKMTVGEKAQHWQVCIWRDWFLPEDVDEQQRLKMLDEGEILERPLMPRSVAALTDAVLSARTWQGYPVAPLGTRLESAEQSAPPLYAARAVALLLPTSLCSGQVALQIAEALQSEAATLGYEGIVALPHTEGCGCSNAPAQDSIFQNVMLGHLLHPCVRHAILLEHGCEKTHNDWFQGKLRDAGRDLSCFGWASIQLDGGIAKVTERIRSHLLEGGPLKAARRQASVCDLRVGVASDHKPSKAEGAALAAVLAEVVRAGGCVMAPHGNPVLSSAELLDEFLEGGPESLMPTMRYGASLLGGLKGFHIMQCPGRLSHAEQVTGLAAAGLDIILALTKKGSFVGSPVVPVLKLCCIDDVVATASNLPSSSSAELGSKDADVVFYSSEAIPVQAERIWALMLQVLSGESCPKHFGSIGDSHVDFVIPRGPAGISL